MKDTEEVIKNFVKDTFPFLDTEKPLKKVLCFYTTTPDEDFIIDKHPLYLYLLITNIIIKKHYNFNINIYNI